MPLHFRKSIVIVPGVRINFSENGVSLSLGLPGSGVSYREGVSYATLVSAMSLTSGATSTQASPPADEKDYSLWSTLLVIVGGGTLLAVVPLVCLIGLGLGRH